MPPDSRQCASTDSTVFKSDTCVAISAPPAKPSAAPVSAGMDRQTLRDWVLRYNEHGIDGRPSYNTFAHRRGMLHIPVIASRGEYVDEGFHL